MGERNLTQGEIDMARTIYGDTIDWSKVKIHDDKHNPFQGDNTVVTPNGEIYYPEGVYSDDFSQESGSLKALLIHELGHVLQDQNGMNVIMQRILDGGDYNYDPIFNGTPFHELPMEAQAEFLEDLYRKRNGLPVDPDKGNGTLDDPDRDLSEYEDVLPMDLPSGNPDAGSLDDLAPEAGTPLKPNSPWILDGVLPQTETPRNEASPLILDLGAMGIDLTSVDGPNAVYWDLDQDGMAEATGWAGSEDGFLALDRNGDGIVTDHTELFGTESIDGFVMLAELDSNGDSIIDANDTAFENLIVWVDANTDGFSQETELYSLTDLGIASIDLNFTVTDYQINGNTVRSESTFTMTDSTERQIVDAWFAYDNVNSVRRQSIVDTLRKKIRCASGSLVSF